MAKEVLMSRRNAPMDHVDATSFSKVSAGGSGSGGLGAYQPPPISNYKGVMLCDRPVVKSGKPTHLESGQAMPFSCSIGPLSKFEQIGLNPSKEERAMRLAMESKVSAKTNDDFFTKHRQWLSQLKKDKKKKDLEEVQYQQEQESKKKKFKEYSAKLRQSIREATLTNPDMLTEEALQKHQQQANIEAQRAEKQQSQATTPDHEEVKKKEKKKKSKKEKPVWAMTEKQLEEREEEDIDDLIKFASDLDFDKYVDDWEVRSALAAVKERVNQLKNGGDGDDDAEVMSLPEGEDWKREFANEWNREDVEKILKIAKEKAKAAGVAVAGSVAKSEMSVGSRASRASRASRINAGDDEEVNDGAPESTMKLAEKLLQSAKELRRIHSSHSVKAILEKDGERRKLPPLSEEPDVGPLMNPPTMVQYNPEDIGGPRGAMKLPLDPSNLPYLHRNPAV